MPVSKHRRKYYSKKKIKNTNNGAFGNEGYTSDRNVKKRAAQNL